LIHKTIVVNTWRYMADSAVRLLVMGFFVLIALMLAQDTRAVRTTSDQDFWGISGTLANMGLWILGTGLIHRDASSGVLSLVFLRPVSRPAYVLSKWLALCSVGWTMALIFFSVLYYGENVLNPLAAQRLLGLVVLIVSVSAVITLFSSLPFSFGDLGTLLLALAVVWILNYLGDHYKVVVLRTASDYLMKAFFPGFWFGLKRDEFPFWLNVIFNLAITAFSLGGAIWLVKRRELGYGEAN
jgi:hypothetical protein